MKINIRNLKVVKEEILKTFRKPRKFTMYYDVVKGKVIKLKKIKT